MIGEVRDEKEYWRLLGVEEERKMEEVQEEEVAKTDIVEREVAKKDEKSVGDSGAGVA